MRRQTRALACPFTTTLAIFPMSDFCDTGSCYRLPEPREDRPSVMSRLCQRLCPQIQNDLVGTHWRCLWWDRIGEIFGVRHFVFRRHLARSSAAGWYLLTSFILNFPVFVSLRNAHTPDRSQQGSCAATSPDLNCSTIQFFNTATRFVECRGFCVWF